MAESQIVNSKGAFGYNTTDIEAGRQRQNVDYFRNMSTVTAIQRAGQAFCYSSLVGEGNEAVAGTTVATGVQVPVGIAIETCTTNTNTTNQSTNHPAGAWFRGVTYGPVWAYGTSDIEKGSVLTISASTVAPLSGGRVGPITTALGSTAVQVIGRALTSATSATTNRNVLIFVNPQVYPTPTS